MSKPTDPKAAALDAAVKQIQKDHGEGAIARLGDRPAAEVKVVPTGIFSIDAALGVGGLPCGRIVEVFGPEMSGKSTLAMHVVAQAQAAGGSCAYVDAEHALDPAYAAAIGVQVDDLLLSQPDSGEQGLEIVDVLVRSGAVDVIVVDSVAALVPQAEIEGDMGQAHVGLQARLMSQALRKLTSQIAKTNTIVIFINQLREKVGVMFGSPETTPGGRALKFYSSVRIDVRRIGALKDGDQVVGNRTRVKVVKNKVAPPFQQVEVDLDYGTGFSVAGDLLDAAVEERAVTKSGAWFAFGGENFAQGRAAAKARLSDPDFAAEVAAAVTAAKAPPGPPADSSGEENPAAA